MARNHFITHDGFLFFVQKRTKIERNVNLVIYVMCWQRVGEGGGGTFFFEAFNLKRNEFS